MNQKVSSSSEWLSIGELADSTGLSAPTLRTWESRHGFPVAHRLASGHRRYDSDHVAKVLDVVRRRALGTRLDVAIEQVLSGPSAGPESVYASVTTRHPEQPRRRLRKATLLGLSWAIEDEVAASGAQGHLFGAFQESRRFDAARPRWAELARVARSTFAFADFAAQPFEETAGVVKVHLDEDAPMRREWSIVHDSDEMPVVLTAWELPGQDATPDRERLFESLWSLDPAAVRTAARCCALIASRGGHGTATDLLQGQLSGPPAPVPDIHLVSRLAHRALAYVDAGPAADAGTAVGA